MRQKPLIKEKELLLVCECILLFTISLFLVLYNCLSYRKSRSTGLQLQPAKRKTQAVSTKKNSWLHFLYKFSFSLCHYCLLELNCECYFRSLPCLCWRSKSWNYHRWHKSSFWAIWENIVSVLWWQLLICVILYLQSNIFLWLHHAVLRHLIHSIVNWISFVHRDCRVVKDMATGKSKGYGFVSFFNKWVSVNNGRVMFHEIGQ